jgi:glycine/D-amino acid oxidase-like deaminating enzyme
MPVWTAYNSEPVAFQYLAAPQRADVIVVGAGITGALVAAAVTAAGLSCVIVDRRPPAGGSTGASTALLQWEIDTPLTHLADHIGFERARQAWLRSFRAVDDLASLVRQLRIPCDFRERRAIYLAGDTLSASALVEEGRWRRQIGLPSGYLDAPSLRSLAGLDREAALLSDRVADVDPSRLTKGLLRRAAARRCRVYSPVQIADVAPSSRKVAMATSEGLELETRAVVFATGYELADGVPSAGHRRSSTWAFATYPQPQALWGCGELIWEAADPYLYIRTTVDGRVVVGGEDEDIQSDKARDALLPVKIGHLQEKTKRLLPWLDVSAEFAWAGTFGESETGLPSIGLVPGMPNCYAVLGYGGNGLTFGLVAAQIIRSFLTGQPDPDSGLFAFES